MRRVTQSPSVTPWRSPSSSFPAAVLGVRLAALALAVVLAGCGDEPLRPVPRGIVGIKPASSGGVSVGFTQVSGGGAHTCALKSDGTLACWGITYLVDATPTSGAFTQVSAGGYHACAVRTDRAVACWGQNSYGGATPPAGDFLQVGAGHEYSCGVKADHTVACWGGRNSSGEATVPMGLVGVTQVSAGVRHTCALKTDKTLTCWGGNDAGQVSGTPTQTTPYTAEATHVGPFTQVTLGQWHTCALRADGTVACWGDNLNGAFVPTTVTGVRQVSTGWNHVCAIVGLEGAVNCWGRNFNGQLDVPAGLIGVVQIGAGIYHTCAVKGDGTIVCWGLNTDGQATPPSPISFFPFAGFFPPVDNPGPDENVVNKAKAGAGIAVKFSLGGDEGLAIFKAGYPRFVSAPCSADDQVTVIDDPTTSPAGLTYDPTTGQYTYVWKTDKAWAGLCGRFELGLVDGSDRHALFRFVR